MCGRFTNRLTWREIVALYRLSVPATPERNLPARYNICPTDTIDTVVEEDSPITGRAPKSRALTSLCSGHWTRPPARSMCSRRTSHGFCLI